MIGAITLFLLAVQPDVPGIVARALSALRAQVAVELVDIEAAKLAGLYQVPPPGIGGLSGEELYLFPDGSYVYCEWADVWPLTVHDKGHWAVSASLLELQSDPDITWSPGVERRHLLFRRSRMPGEALLLGLGMHLSILERAKKAGDDSSVVWLSLSRGAVYENRPEATRLKAELMRRAWRPEAFRKAP